MSLLEPPIARRIPRIHEIHGETRTDDYSWMREKSDPEVEAYLRAENAYAEAVMSGTEDLQKQLYNEMLGHIKETDLSVPYRNRGWFYYHRTEEGKQYPIRCRKRGILEEVRGLDAAKAVPLIEDVIVTAHLREEIVPLPEGASYLGFAFARGESPGLVEAALRAAGAKLEVMVTPRLPVTKEKA